MISITLDDIAQIMSGTLVVGSSGRLPTDRVSGDAQTDSRLVLPGQIFFAKRGETTDGHRFVGVAYERGAHLAIVEEEIDDRIAQIVVKDSVIALADLAREVVSRVKRLGRMRVIGITGSNGKTTTKNLLLDILQTRGETVAPTNSFNNEVGAPLTMLRITEETDFLISEMGANAEGDIARLASIAQPDIGVVLKVGLAHAGGFGGIEATFRAKSEMVSSLGSSGIAVLNRDDTWVTKMSDLTKAHTIWFGTTADCDVRATDVHAAATGTRFRVVTKSGEERQIDFKILGEHHVSNALAAIAVAEECGVPLRDTVASLESVTRAERWRMEVMGGRNNITIINDAYNASPDSMTAALKTLALISSPAQRTFAVLGEMSELGEFSGDEHDRIGLQAVRYNISRIVVVGDGARRMHITAINEGSWDGESVFFSGQDEAYDYLITELREGDIALVKSSNSAGLRFLGDRLGEFFS
ncbi:UDP-N-acetylmuramoyl-tripeptide--D-alanyl-D-alanine ligase [Lysinibacter sp. HNR]|uniref:UDP-N-acetylmuramoyl-tripeptide--D-alanyl-D- alanine ligase n=1 Tax=Lysinibacter sp. HNR TaxID=3031408 RepID=UPI002435CCFB|nr:UDP-N-acetylmuramoyl-tripeptide--D-alanyl-D-alanine ligase [Lysinibacter sp. HNR]WGD36473.1 UDP-N-acetylmuramoyl-tripeptide--D-alanyl-D-alanine ligase [Lysinibacter sp. HNR]